MSDAEAESIAKATKNVARHYPTIAASEKIVDWTMLLWTLGSVYGTRVYLSMPEKPKQKPAPSPQTVSNVMAYPGVVPN